MEGKRTNQDGKNSNDFFSIFVDSDLLNSKTSQSQSSQKVYEINGKSYTEKLDVEEGFEEFKLYAEKIGAKDKENEPPVKIHKFEVQLAENGYIINSALFLNTLHFNAMRVIFGNCILCCLCNDIVMEHNCDVHVASPRHKKRMMKYPLVKEHGLDMFRLVKHEIHCGVCNELFEKETYASHLEAETHINNKIFASQKAAEVIIKLNASVKIKNNDIKNKNNEIKNKNNRNGHFNEKTNRYERMFSIEVLNKVFDVGYLTWHMISDIQSKEYYHCLACNIKVPKDNIDLHIGDIPHENNLREFVINDSYEDHLIRQNTKWAHCCSCNSIHYIDAIDMHIMTHATSSSKSPKKENNGNINNENKRNGGRNENNDTPNKSNGSRNQNNDTPNESNGSRNQNNDAPYISNGSRNQNNGVVIKSSDTRIQNNNASAKSFTCEAISPETNGYRHFHRLNSLVNGNCFVYLFGFQIQVSVLSLNVIFPHNTNFYCGLCRIYFFYPYLQDHMNSIMHRAHLTSTPAMQHYGYNYIRWVYNEAHCGICHMFLLPRMVWHHVHEVDHVMRTKKALGIFNLPPPTPQVVRVTPNVKKYEECDQKKVYHTIDNNNRDESKNKRSETEEKIDGTKNIIVDSKKAIDLVRNVIDETRNNIDETENVISNAKNTNYDTKNTKTLDETTNTFNDTKNKTIGTKNTINETNNSINLMITIIQKTNNEINDTNTAVKTKNTLHEVIQGDKNTGLIEEIQNLTIGTKNSSNGMKNVSNDTKYTSFKMKNAFLETIKTNDETQNTSLKNDTTNNINLPKDTTFEMDNDIKKTVEVTECGINEESKTKILNNKTKDTTFDMENTIQEKKKAINQCVTDIVEKFKSKLDKREDSKLITNNKIHGMIKTFDETNNTGKIEDTIKNIDLPTFEMEYNVKTTTKSIEETEIIHSINGAERHNNETKDTTLKKENIVHETVKTMNEIKITGVIEDTTNNRNLPKDATSGIEKNIQKTIEETGSSGMSVGSKNIVSKTKDLTFETENPFQETKKPLYQPENTNTVEKFNNNINETNDTTSKTNNTGSIDTRSTNNRRRRIPFNTQLSVSEALRKLDQYLINNRIPNTKNIIVESKSKTGRTLFEIRNTNNKPKKELNTSKYMNNTIDESQNSIAKSKNVIHDSGRTLIEIKNTNYKPKSEFKTPRDMTNTVGEYTSRIAESKNLINDTGRTLIEIKNTNNDPKDVVYPKCIAETKNDTERRLIEIKNKNYEPKSDFKTSRDIKNTIDEYKISIAKSINDTEKTLNEIKNANYEPESEFKTSRDLTNTVGDYRSRITESKNDTERTLIEIKNTNYEPKSEFKTSRDMKNTHADSKNSIAASNKNNESKNELQTEDKHLINDTGTTLIEIKNTNNEPKSELKTSRDLKNTIDEYKTSIAEVKNETEKTLIEIKNTNYEPKSELKTSRDMKNINDESKNIHDDSKKATECNNNEPNSELKPLTVNIDKTTKKSKKSIKSNNIMDMYSELNKGIINENESIFDAEVDIVMRFRCMKISLTSYNTLVPIGDGDRYCFACKVYVESEMLKSHMLSETHMENISSLQFLESYNHDLIRQNTSLYHCAICNTILRRPEIKNHLQWTTHDEQRKKIKKIITPQQRETEFKSNVLPTRIEEIYSSKLFKEIIIKGSYIINNEGRMQNNQAMLKNNKKIILNDLNLHLILKWDAWHSIIRNRRYHSCLICQEKIETLSLDDHLNCDKHKMNLDKPFLKEYFPALLREINFHCWHCLICNTNLCGEKSFSDHINNNHSSHKTKFEMLLKFSEFDVEFLDDVLIL